MSRARRYLNHVAAVSLGIAAACAFHRPLSAAPTATATAPQPDPNAIAASIQTFYAPIRTFSSDFKQAFFTKMHPDAPLTSNGRVVFEKPGKMSFRSANGNRLVSDGQILKMYEPANQQMFVQSLAGTQYAQVLAFLTGGANLTTLFTLQLLAPANPGTYRLKGTPKSPNAPYRTVVFYVDAATSQVRKLVIVDAQSNRNEYEFVNPIVNVPVPPGEFIFAPPPGTQIVTNATPATNAATPATNAATSATSSTP